MSIIAVIIADVIPKLDQRLLIASPGLNVLLLLLLLLREVALSIENIFNGIGRASARKSPFAIPQKPNQRRRSVLPKFLLADLSYNKFGFNLVPRRIAGVCIGK